MADNDRDNPEQQQPGEVRIMDLRHSRDGKAEEEEAAAEQAAEPAAAEPSVAEPAARESAPAEGAPASREDAPRLEVVGSREEDKAGATTQEAMPSQDVPNAEPGEPGAEEYYDEEMPAELEQLRQVFGVGISAYLRGQVSLMANFALIYLGRTPNPASGLVLREMEKARIAIDMLEFVSSRIAPELNEQERREVASLLAELKYMYMQGLGDAAPGSPQPQL